MARVDFRARLAGPFLILLIGAACGSDTTETRDIGVVPRAPDIQSFTASPATISPGGFATLAWLVSDAVSVAIADGEGNPVSIAGSDIARGSVTVSPAETTSYTLVAHGQEGAPGPVDRTVMVTVDSGSVGVPVIDAFAASATSITVGETVTLSWQTSNATVITLKDDAGVEVALGNAPVAQGSVGVKPTRSPIAYTLIATGGGRSATAEVSVAVDGLPRVHHFSVDPMQPVTAGADVKLLWETSRADRVVIKDDLGAVVVDATEASGVRTIPLDRTTEFRLTATGNGADASAKTLARVGAGLVEFTAEPRVARAGDPITLTWQTAGADAVVITGPGGFRLEVPPAEMNVGTATVGLLASGDYILHAWLADVVRTWAIFVEATEAPRIRSLTSDRSILTAAADHPGQVILTYVQDSGATCTLFRNGQVVREFTCLPTDTIEVDITGTSELRLVAANHAGTDQFTVPIKAVDPARIPVFTKDPARRLHPGGTVELAWQVTEAIRVWMTRKPRSAVGGTGVTVSIGEKDFASDLTTEVTEDTIFTLFAENSIGHVRSRELLVLAGEPEIIGFKVEPRVAKPSDALLFTWTCDGGDTLVLKDQDATVVASETVPARIDGGTASSQAPPTPTFPNSLTYTLTVQNNASQTTVDTLQLIVTDGPLVRSLTASASGIALGETVDITWVVDNDFAGDKPTLVLTDHNDKTYSLTGLDPNSDTVTIRPEGEGIYTFTLTATTPGTRPSEGDVDPVVVDVRVAPEIISFAADPSVVSTEDNTVRPISRLAWETEYAVELWVFEATATGEAIPPALFHSALADGALQTELDAGHFEVRPLETTRYLLRVANRVGTIVDETLVVVVDPPVIEFFESEDTDLILGERTTLNWKTKNATTVMIQPMSPVVTALPYDSTRFVDISTLAGATSLALTGTDSQELITFPEGFRFPFDGKLFDRVWMATNGFLSFDVAGGKLYDSASDGAWLPSSSSFRYVHLAVWWASLAGSTVRTTGKAWWYFDEAERTFTIMWKNWSANIGSAAYDLNFEVVLHENGSFEYRYGTFSTTGTGYLLDYTSGVYATIGFQDLAGTGYHLVSRKTAIPNTPNNGPTHRAWRFSVPSTVDGTLDVTPLASRTYKLSAANVDLIVTGEPQDVRVWTVPVISAISIYPSAPRPGEPVTFSWMTSRASRVRLVDEQGTIICETTDPVGVIAGSCARTFETTGTRNWQLQVINGIDRNLATRPIVFGVFDRLTIDEFRVHPPVTTSGQEVVVTWVGQGGYRARLYECPPKTAASSVQTACQEVDLADQDPNLGEYRATVTASKEYWLRLTDRQSSRVAEATGNVWVDIPEIQQFTSSARQIEPGKDVTLTWNTAGTSISLTPLPPPEAISEGFVDISSTGTPVAPSSLTSSSVDYTLNFGILPEPFVFSYFGEAKTALYATSQGYIGFDTSNKTTGIITNTALPNTSNSGIEIAPFWDNLKKGNNTTFHWLLDSKDGVKYLILQWTALEFSTGTGSSLNFQVWLWETGEIDFRYGVMSGPNAALAAGSEATIGIQAKKGTWGHMLSYNQEIPGTLRNRSWRFRQKLEPSGQMVAAPTESTTYRLCVANSSLYDVCEDKRVVVVKGGSLLISEIMIRPTSPEGEWIELRNLSPDPIDIAGFRLTSDTNEVFPIPLSAPILVGPGDFAVLARSGSPSDNGDVSPAVIYEDITLDDVDKVSLQYGDTLIDSVAWTAAWNVLPDQSLSMEPARSERLAASNDSSSAWCVSSEIYGGGFRGSPGALGPGCQTGGAHDFYWLDPWGYMPWIDIAKTGTAVNTVWSTPYYSPPITLGFDFPYFGVTVTEMTITKNGAIALTPPVGTLPDDNSSIPNASTQPNGLVAPMWDTMYANTKGAVRYRLEYVDGLHVMVVQWNDVAVASSSGSYGLANFQLQLWETGEIVFVYGNPTPPASSSYANYTYIYGSGATIGIENISGNLAYEIYSNSASTGAKPADVGRSYRFIPR